MLEGELESPVTPSDGARTFSQGTLGEPDPPLPGPPDAGVRPVQGYPGDVPG